MAARTILSNEMLDNKLPGRFWSYKCYCDDICSMPRIVCIHRTRYQTNAENNWHTRSKCWGQLSRNSCVYRIRWNFPDTVYFSRMLYCCRTVSAHLKPSDCLINVHSSSITVQVVLTVFSFEKVSRLMRLWQGWCPTHRYVCANWEMKTCRMPPMPYMQCQS